MIDIALTTENLEPLTLWEIPEEYPSLSDHELILLQWEDLSSDASNPISAVSTGWNIQSLLEDKTLLKAAKDEQEKYSSKRPHFTLASSIEHLNHEVLWFKEEITKLLDIHVKITRVTSHSKRWWNDDGTKARKAWAKEKKKLSMTNNNTAELKKARYAYYRVTRKAKRVCWQKFLQGEASNNVGP